MSQTEFSRQHCRKSRQNYTFTTVSFCWDTNAKYNDLKGKISKHVGNLVIALIPQLNYIFFYLIVISKHKSPRFSIWYKWKLSPRNKTIVSARGNPETAINQDGQQEERYITVDVVCVFPEWETKPLYHRAVSGLENPG